MDKYPLFSLVFFISSNAESTSLPLSQNIYLCPPRLESNVPQLDMTVVPPKGLGCR